MKYTPPSRNRNGGRNGGGGSQQQGRNSPGSQNGVNNSRGGGAPAAGGQRSPSPATARRFHYASNKHGNASGGTKRNTTQINDAGGVDDDIDAYFFDQDPALFVGPRRHLEGWGLLDSVVSKASYYVDQAVSTVTSAAQVRAAGGRRSGRTPRARPGDAAAMMSQALRHPRSHAPTDVRASALQFSVRPPRRPPRASLPPSTRS